jgi:hypothetical protein
MADRSADEIKTLRLAARDRAAVCADCFAPLAPEASVTMRWRFVGANAAEHDHLARVPICLHCWLVELMRPPELYRFRGARPWQQDEAEPRLSSILNEVRRLRCEGCSRPMRVEVRRIHRLTRSERCCCNQCFRAVVYRFNNQRRRVRHQPIACVVCGTTFTPQKANATTCSGKCRVKLHRLRAQGERER